MTAAPLPRSEPGVGCVLEHALGVLVVLTDVGPVRASYGARLLGAVGRDRSRAPRRGEWVSLRHWPDGPVTAEEVLRSARESSGPAPALARVVPLRRRVRP